MINKKCQGQRGPHDICEKDLNIRTSGFANRISTNPARLWINWISWHLETRMAYPVLLSFVFLFSEIKFVLSNFYDWFQSTEF
jgi:hypothetical protein